MTGHSAITPTVSRNMRLSTWDGAFFSFMVGVGETYFPAFILALGLGQIASGLIATVPLMIGALLQMAAPYGVRWFGSFRKWVGICATIQAITFVPLINAAIKDRASVYALFAVISLYWAAGLAISPAWNTWIEGNIPRKVRPKFFSTRTRVIQTAGLIGFLFGGAVLHWGSSTMRQTAAFALLFLVAGLSRLLSSQFLLQQTETDSQARHCKIIRPMELIRRWRKGHDGRFILYLLLVHFTVQIGAPFYAPFMLAKLELGYTTYTGLIGTAFVAKIVILYILGRLGDRVHPNRLLLISGIAISPLAAMWIISQHIPYLVCVQILSGFMWGTWEYASFMLIFDKIKTDERTGLLTLYNVGYASATAIGSLVGGAVLGLLDKTFAAYLVVFGLSAAMRALSVIPLWQVVKHVPDQIDDTGGNLARQASSQGQFRRGTS